MPNDLLVRVVKDWASPDLLRQSPGGTGVWGDIRFTLEPVKECDYVVVLNRVPEDTEVCCPVENIWAIVQEPPVEEYRWLRQGFLNISKVITSDVTLNAPYVTHDSLALPWHVNKSFDELLQLQCPDDKPCNISWITSNATGRQGHQRRMVFLNELKKVVDFDLFGRGFNPIDDKFMGIYPYKYTLAVENHNGPYYWTEKLSDCFLSWTMPIYYGCTNIDTYFPRESYIQIDIAKPREAAEILKRAVHGNAWKKNLDAIEQSRNLILQKYQFFPYIAGKINDDLGAAQSRTSSVVRLKGLPYSYPMPYVARIRQNIAKHLRSTLSLIRASK
jgi:hypothetical protein